MMRIVSAVVRLMIPLASIDPEAVQMTCSAPEPNQIGRQAQPRSKDKPYLLNRHIGTVGQAPQVPCPFFVIPPRIRPMISGPPANPSLNEKDGPRLNSTGPEDQTKPKSYAQAEHRLILLD